MAKDRGTDYLRDRLTRGQHHDLLCRVDRGELSVREAARCAGILRPYFSCVGDDVNLAVRKILKHYDRAELIAALNQ